MTSDKITIPDTLKIGCFDYIVEQVSGLGFVDEDGNRNGAFGTISVDNIRIRLEKEMPDQRVLPTVVHEAIHAILAQAGIDDHKEKYVTVLGYGLAALLLENKPFFRQFLEGE